MSLSIAAERLAAEQEGSEVVEAAEATTPVAAIPEEIIKAAEAVYVSIEAVPVGDEAQQDSGENNVVQTEN